MSTDVLQWVAIGALTVSNLIKHFRLVDLEREIEEKR